MTASTTVLCAWVAEGLIVYHPRKHVDRKDCNRSYVAEYVPGVSKEKTPFTYRFLCVACCYIGRTIFQADSYKAGVALLQHVLHFVNRGDTK